MLSSTFGSSGTQEPHGFSRGGCQDELYLSNAQVVLGRVLDFAVYDLEYSLSDFWRLFLKSPVSKRFQSGDSSTLVGKSGVELAFDVIEDYDRKVVPKYTENRSIEYWVGWAIAYYQWKTNLTFEKITEIISIDDIALLYNPYHEMDVRHFCDRMDIFYRQKHKTTNLKLIRERMGISQRELSERTGISVRTIQQYEQRQKNIGKAQSNYLIALAKALYCEPSDLLEAIDYKKDS